MTPELSKWLERAGLTQRFNALSSYYRACGKSKRDADLMAEGAFPIDAEPLELALLGSSTRAALKLSVKIDDDGKGRGMDERYLWVFENMELEESMIPSFPDIGTLGLHRAVRSNPQLKQKLYEIWGTNAIALARKKDQDAHEDDGRGVEVILQACMRANGISCST